MTDTPRVAITGSTGRVGSRVARALDGVPMRLLVRDPSRAPVLKGTQVVVAEYSDRTAVRAALDGIDTVLMISAQEEPDRIAVQQAFIEEAEAAGVGHVVYTSLVSADPDSSFSYARDHGHAEAQIKASSMAWTILRDNLYLELGTLLADPTGVIRGPAGDGRMAAVSIEDVAACATVVLSAPTDHVGMTYTLTGPEALSFTELTERLRGWGYDLRYQPETLEEAYASRQQYAAEPWQLDAWISSYLAIARGEMAEVSDDVERLLGRPPRSLADVFRR